mmetsp:Transcript_26194/g.38801  ORF Transcript_26194/g.38801 Transcript_26194/m.38801 type:complete len:434 (-) Transcript_26194:190-1491(-)
MANPMPWRFLIVVLLAHMSQVQSYDISDHDKLNQLHSLSIKLLENEEYRRDLTEQMSNGCLDRMCLMLQSFTSCKAFPIQWEKICSKYFMGYLFECPVFPSKDAITDAPSVCLEDLASLAAGMPDISEIATSGNRSDDCQMDCYQTYLERAMDFFNTCNSEVQNSPYQKVAQLSIFQVYRGQVCAFNGKDDNCVDLLTDLVPNISDPSQSPLFDYSCSFPDEAYVLLCNEFESMKCCFGNQLTILEQTFNMMYAPCAMDRLSKCPMMDVSSFCSEGTLTDLGNVQTTIAMNISYSQGLPDMSNETSVLIFRSVLGGAVGLLPTEVAILSYQYYNNTLLPTSNIESAVSGTFTYMVIMASTTNSSWNSVVEQLDTPEYEGAIAQTYNTDPSNVVVTVGDYDYYTADPIDTSRGFRSLPGLYWAVLSAILVILIV